MNRFHLARVTCASPRVAVADPSANADEILAVLADVPDSDIVLFPELSVTGYTCGDLFGQSTLLDASDAALGRIAGATRGRAQLVVVGAPVAAGSALYNAAVAIADGEILGVVPKQFLPNYKEFYEARWFAAGEPPGAGPAAVELLGRPVPFGADLLFEAGPGVLVGVEICEDLWMPVPPSSPQALAGANILLNLSASNETIGKHRYRSNLVLSQSGRCIAAYAYAGAGPTESTTDLVFGGHCLIAENGHLLGESGRVGGGASMHRGTDLLTRDVDVEKIANDRRATSTFHRDPAHRGPYRRIPFALATGMEGLRREVLAAPFVPKEGAELHRRCAEIFGIQCAGLAKRIERLPSGTSLNIGISGGLDSTLALLVAVKTCDLLGLPRATVRGLTMPGFGTTARTRANALALMDHLGVGSATIDISELALQTFRELGHAPFGIDCREISVADFRAALDRVPRERRQDLTFENVQARLRTFLLMSRGFVVGTGDVSELALGWATYNGDHMSMYNPNVSIPKTLVKFLVRYVAEHEFPAGAARDTLLSIVATPISPELLPPSAAGEIEQSTEDVLGPYELHDFFLFHAIRCGYGPEKILFLAGHARFGRDYAPGFVAETLRTFYRRFFSQQFKRSCLPDGPKVGTVSLSPRGDWRMPSDAEAAAWLARLDGAAEEEYPR